MPHYTLVILPPPGAAPVMATFGHFRFRLYAEYVRYRMMRRVTAACRHETTRRPARVEVRRIA